MESAYAQRFTPPTKPKPCRTFLFREPLVEPLHLETKDLPHTLSSTFFPSTQHQNIHIRLIVGDEKYTLLVEARDKEGGTWVLGMPLHLAKEQHMKVMDFWKERLAIELSPVGGCVMKFEKKHFVCGGFSGTFKKKVDVEAYTRLFNYLLEKGVIHKPVRDSHSC